MSARIAAVAAFVATMATQVPALPPQEMFVRQTGLNVGLQLAQTTLHVGQDPQFALRFENTGSGDLYLSPHVEPRFYVTRTDGAPVPPPISAIIERVPGPRIKPADLVRLGRGKPWVVPVSATSFRDRFAAYAERLTEESGWVLLLPPGRYVARFTYINSPDYGGGWYDPYEMTRGIWEGRIEAEPVTFTVVAPTSEELARDTSRLGRADAVAMLRVLSLPPTEIVRDFIAKPDSRFDILRAAQVQREELIPQLLRALDSIQSRDRDYLLYSAELSQLLRGASGCESLHYLTARLASTGADLLRTFRTVFENAASRCPDVRPRLRSIVQDTTQGRDARANAAALLGTFKNAVDVPLLAELLDTAPSGAADPGLRGAFTGLAIIGGESAREAMARALSNEARTRAIGGEAINRLGIIGGPDVVAPLLAALSSTNSNILISALGGLSLARQQVRAPRIIELLRHQDPIIRRYAARAVRRTAGGSALEAMRAAVADVDVDVQQDALFYLAEHGDSSDLEVFMTHLDSPNQYVCEAATAGVARFGTAATFPRVRKLLDAATTSAAARASQAALSALSFVGDIPRRTPQQWDQWYARHRTTTRIAWAREALDGLKKMMPFAETRWRYSAISYLADQDALSFQRDFENAATSRRSTVRVEAVRAIARVDPKHAASLLVREFDGRLVTACELANGALNELAGSDRRVECTDPADRRRARDEWMQTDLFR